MNSLHIKIRMPSSLVPSLLHIGAQRIETLVVRNNGAGASGPIELRLEVPGLSVAPIRVRLPALRPGEEVEITDVLLPLDHLDRLKLEALQNRDDGLPCKLQVTCKGHLVAEQEFSLLPPNAWSYRVHPEALAAFVDKESRAVYEVRASARQHLRRHLGVGSFELALYRSLKELRLPSEFERTRQIVCSLYECLLESFQIHYELELRTYPVEWQKIRFHGRVLGEREGTCIDLGLLTLACLEAVPLDPMLILIRTGPNLQHVLLACWEQQSHSPTAVITDHDQMEAWLKPTSSGHKDLLLWDPVGFAVENGWPFSEACEEGWSSWQTAGPANFVCAIDVVRARESGISPMPFGEGPHYSPEGWAAVEEAEVLAKKYDFDIVERGHLFLALLDQAEETSATALGTAVSDIKEKTEARLRRKSPRKPTPNPKRAAGLKNALRRAQELAEEQGAGLIRPVQLWHALVEDPGNTVGRILSESHVNTVEAIKTLVELANEDPQRQSYTEWRSTQS